MSKKHFSAEDIEKFDRRNIWHPFTRMGRWMQEQPLLVESGSGSVLRDIHVAQFDVRLVQPLHDGLRFQLVNEQHGLFIPVEFRAASEGFRMTVKAGWICEQMSINRRLMELDVLPDLMTTKVGDDGL